MKRKFNILPIVETGVFGGGETVLLNQGIPVAILYAFGEKSK